MKLTDIQVNSFKPQNKPYRRADGRGMYIEVHPNGSKYWRFRYRYLGAQKTLALGVYPDVSLKEAREKLNNARKLLEDGRDPSKEKKKRKQLKENTVNNTFEKVACEWHELNSERWNPAYREEILRRLKNDIFPEIGDFPISEIEPPLLLATLRKIEARGAHEVARRQLQKCGEVFKYAIVTGRCIRNPATDLQGALRPTKKSHYACIEIAEVPDFLKALNSPDNRMYKQTRLALRFMMLTFQRTGEMINTKWEEIDWQKSQWHIPAERMKKNRDHIVPLSHQAIAILEELREMHGGKWQWVFPNQIRPKKPMSNNTILSALEQLGYKGKMTGHGFRSLAMSVAKQELGYRHEVPDRQLAHVPDNKVDKAYDRAKFLKERTAMMQDYADWLDAQASNGKVVKANFRKTG